MTATPIDIPPIDIPPVVDVADVDPAPTPAGLADRVVVNREFLAWAAVFIAAPGVGGCTVTTEFGFWPGLATLIILAVFVGGVAWLTRNAPRRTR